MKVSKSFTEKLVREKAAVEKNSWYLILQEDMEDKLKKIQEGLGIARTADFAAMKFEQGRIDAHRWILRRPDKLLNELIKTLEE